MDRATRYTNIAYRWAGLIMLCVPVGTLGVLRYNQECAAGVRYDCAAVYTDATEYSISTLNYAQLRHWFKPNYHYVNAPRGSRMSTTYLSKTRVYEGRMLENEVSDERVDEWFVWHLRNRLPFEFVRITNPYLLSRWWDIPGLVFMFWTVLAIVYFRRDIGKYCVWLARESVKEQTASSTEGPTYRHAPFRVPPQPPKDWLARGLGYSVPLGFLIGGWMVSIGMHPFWSVIVGGGFAYLGSAILATAMLYVLFCMGMETGAAIWTANLMIGWVLMLAWAAVLFLSVSFLLVVHRPNGLAEQLTRGLQRARTHLWRTFSAFISGR